MSYTATGSYYEFEPHQIFSGMGSYYEFSPHQIFSGFGQFSASSVWNDWLRGTQCGKDGNWNSASCKAALSSVTAIRGGLKQLGYGDLPGGAWGPTDQAAWKKFAADNQLDPSAGMPTKAGLQKLDSLLAVEAVVAPDEGEGMSTAGAITVGLVGVALVGLVVVAKKRKR